MKFIVVGCGSIGRRHISNLLSLGESAVGVDLNEEYRSWVESNLKIKTYSDFSEAILSEKPDAALICTPPSSHVPLSLIALKKGLHVFIEKPLSDSKKGIDTLEKLAKKKKLTIAVGYNHRFNPVIEKLKELIKGKKTVYARVSVGQYLPDWRPWQDYRKSYTAIKGLGGGIILDASHEIDYVRWLFGEPEEAYAVSGKLSSLEVETEDVAEIILKMKNGPVVSVHLDFVRRDPIREGEAVSLESTIKWDLRSGKISIFDPVSKSTSSMDVQYSVDKTYVDEMKDFINSIKSNTNPRVALDDARKTLDLALKIKKAAGV
jgi:predicted dehydrogenase